MRAAAWVLMGTLLWVAPLAVAQVPLAAPPPKPYIVIVSLNGVGPDQARQPGARTLHVLATHGASAPDGMLPAYPTASWPNLYTLATGLYPEHHGIVANRFRSADGAREFRADDAASSADGRWYGGTPLWVLAQRQGVSAACVAWPGCTAAIGGVRPAFTASPEKTQTDAARVQLLLTWLQQPAPNRPHLLLLALHAVEQAASQSGPASPEAAKALAQTDSTLARLRAGLAALKLPVDLLVVSDHGYLQVTDPPIALETYTSLAGVATAGALLYPADEAGAQRLYEQLKIADEHFEVYRRANLPKALHAGASTRMGDPVIVPIAPVVILARKPGSAKNPAESTPGNSVDNGASRGRGVAGADAQRFAPLRAVFYAEGPDIAPGVRLKLFENTNVYPLVASLLGLVPPPTDGSEGVLSPLRRPSDAKGASRPAF